MSANEVSGEQSDIPTTAEKLDVSSSLLLPVPLSNSFFSNTFL